MTDEWHWLTEKAAESRGKVVQAVSDLYRTDELEHGVLEYYTIHNTRHCVRVEDLLHELIPDKKAEQLSVEERYLLLTSAWLHDLGMLKSVVREKTLQSTELTAIALRDKHHKNSAWFVSNRTSKCGLDEEHAPVMANLCLYHRRREDINRLEPKVLIGTTEIRQQLLAAYLRLADALDIGSHRAPKRAYAMWLASDIPAEYRIHWIRNRLVTGISIDHESKTIMVGFQKPRCSNDARFAEKIDYIIKLVMQDLRYELMSVMSVLIRGGLPFFVDVIERPAETELSDHMIDDLRRLVDNYTGVHHPSASRLYQVLLNATADVAGFKLRDTQPGPEFLASDSSALDFVTMNSDLQELQAGLTKLLKVRPHHVALREVNRELRHMINDGLAEQNYRSFAGRINAIHQEYRECRRNVRGESTSFFKSVLESGSDHGFSHDRPCTFLLYGYSELVMKALGGFRDAVLMNLAPGIDSRDLYDSPIEVKASRLFEIYICDGQSKTHTDSGDRLTYHDGIEYALALRKRKFTNITLIPDIVAGHVFEHRRIDIVLVGANGLNSGSFKHSAGHASIIGLAREFRRNNMELQHPKIVVITTSAKYTSEEFIDSEVSEERDSIWLTRDPERFVELERNNIKLYNPKHDDIPLHYVDCIITEKGWREINPRMSSLEEVEGAIRDFIEFLTATA